MSRKEKIILAELDVCEIAAIWDELHQIETEIQAVERTDAPTFSEREEKKRCLEGLKRRQAEIQATLGLSASQFERQQSDTSGQSLTTSEIGLAFSFVPKLKAKLSDVNNHEWMHPALVSRGRAPKPNLWNPLLLAKLLLDRSMATQFDLNKAFRSDAKLKPWREEWQEIVRERNAFGR